MDQFSGSVAAGHLLFPYYVYIPHEIFISVHLLLTDFTQHDSLVIDPYRWIFFGESLFYTLQTLMEHFQAACIPAPWQCSTPLIGSVSCTSLPLLLKTAKYHQFTVGTLFQWQTLLDVFHVDESVWLQQLQQWHSWYLNTRNSISLSSVWASDGHQA